MRKTREMARDAISILRHDAANHHILRGRLEGYPTGGDLWGKFRSAERDGPAWHPLVDHCTDVACVLEALLAPPTIRRRLARAGGLDDFDEVQVARLCYLAFLHDIGKCNWGFQRKILPGVADRAGHVTEVTALLLDEPLAIIRAFSTSAANGGMDRGRRSAAAVCCRLVAPPAATSRD